MHTASMLITVVSNTTVKEYWETWVVKQNCNYKIQWKINHI